MSIEGPRIVASDKDRDTASSFQDAVGDQIETPDSAVVVAQAEGDPVPLPDDQAGQAGVPDIPSEIVPDASNVVRLPAGVTIEELRIDGADIVLVQPDGSEIRIVNAALDVPTFVIDGIEVPQEVLLAVLSDNGIDVAAGPDGQLSVVGPAPQGSGGNFQDQLGDGEEGETNFLALLQNTEQGDGGGGEEQITDGSGVTPTILAGGDTGTLVESDDVPGGIDSEPEPATGSISFFDPDFGETRTAAITGRAIVSSNIVHGPTLTAAQIDALLDGFTLDDAATGGVTTEPSAAGNGSVDWTYNVANALIDFLAEGETIVLDFVVTISDGINDTPTTVRITVRGTNDRPIFTTDDIAVIDEEAVFANGNDGDSYPGPGGQDVPGGAPPPGGGPFTGSLGIVWGPDDYSDNAQTVVNGEVTFTGDIAWSNGTPLTSRGEAIEITPSDGGQTLTGATASGRIVFVATVDQQGSGNGSYTFDLQDVLDHPEANAEDSVQLTFGLTVTDSNGVEQDHAFTVSINDDAPVAGSRAFALVDEDALTQPFDSATGNRDVQDGDDFPQTDFSVDPDNNFNRTTVAGRLAISWGADDGNDAENGGITGSPVDGDRAVTFAIPDAIDALEALVLTSQGDDLAYALSANGTVLTATADDGSGPRTVFTVTLSDLEDGSFVFDLDDTLDHEDGGTEDNIDLVFHFTATDSDGDPTEGSFTVSVDDDSPVIGSPAFALVDEDALTQPFDNATGNRDWQPGDNFPITDFSVDPDFDRTTVAGRLAISWGADDGNDAENGGITGAPVDGDRAVTFTSADTDAADVIAAMVAKGLTSGGEDLQYALSDNGTELLAYRGAPGMAFDAVDAGIQVFRVSLSDLDDGSFVFDLIDALDHEDGGFENNIFIDFDFFATDSDGDQTEGSFTVSVDDDSPVADGAAAELTPSENDIDNIRSHGTSPGDGPDDGSTSEGSIIGGGDAATASTSLAGVVSFGADGQAAGGGYGFIDDPVAFMNALGLTSKSAALTYQMFGNTLGGFVDNNSSGDFTPGDRPVFTLTLDPVTGEVTYQQYDQLDHVDGDDDNTQLATAYGPLDSIDFGAVIEATDGDGDVVNLAGKFSVTVTDDVPEISISADEVVRIDESGDDDDNLQGFEAFLAALVFAGVDNPGSDSDLGGPIYAYQDDLIDYSINGGTDDNVSASLTLRIEGGNGTDSGLRTTAGDAIFLFLEDGQVVGRISSGEAAFALNLDTLFDGVGIVQYMSLQHANGNNPDDRRDLDGKISAVLRVEDHDGDVVEESVAIGNRIRFDDDGPATTGNGRTAETLDEDDIVAIIDSQGAGTDGSGPVIVTGAIGKVDLGADGFGRALFDDVRINGTGVSENVAAIDAAGAAGIDTGLTSDGEAVHIRLDTPTSMTAFIASTGETVFTVTLDGSSLGYTIELVRNIDHVFGSDSGRGNRQVIDFTVRVEDGDGDPTFPVLRLRLDDDEPVAPNVTSIMDEDDDTHEVMLVNGSDFEFGADDAGDVDVDTDGATITDAPDGVTLDVTQVGIAFDAGTGTITITPGTAFDALAVTETATLRIPYTVTDGDGDTATHEITITVTGANDAPVITSGNAAETIDEPGDIAGINEAGLTNPSAPPGAPGLEPFITLSSDVTLALDSLLTAPETLDTVLASVQTALSGTLGQAIAVVWDYLDGIYVADGPDEKEVNHAFVRLGLAYADALKHGTVESLLDVVAKYTPDGGDADDLPQRVQSLHDNLLGNVTSDALDQRFGPTGANPDQDLLEDLTGAVELVDAGLLGRTYFEGSQGEDVSAARDFDIAHGLAPAASGTMTAHDVDVSDTLTWSDVTGAPGAFGAFTIDATTGDWSYVLTPGSVDALGVGDFETETFTVQVSDGNGGDATATVTITIEGANDAPVIEATSDVTGTVHEAGSIAGVTEAGPAGPLSHGFTITTDIASLGTNAVATHFESVYQAVLGEVGGDAAAIAVLWQFLDDNYPGNVIDHPINVAFVRLGAKYAGLLANGQIGPLTEVIAKYTADGPDAGNAPDRMQSLHDNLLGNLKGSVIASRFELYEGDLTNLVDEIDPTGDALLGRTAFSGEEDGGTGTYDTGATYDADNGIVAKATGTIDAGDVDLGADLTFSVDAAAGAFGAFSIHPDTGEWTYVVDQAKANSLGVGENPVETFTVTVTDEHGAIDTVEVSVTVTGANDAPDEITLSGDSLPADAGDDYVIGTVTVTDVDSTPPFTFVVTNPDGTTNADLEVVEFAPGSYQLQTTGSVTSLPASITITADDGDGGAYADTFVVTLPVQLFAPDQTTLLGSYSTIQGAVDAAGADGRDGLLVDIGAGTYAEDVTVTDQALILRGNGSVTVEGEITVAGELNDGFRIENVTIDATGNAHGINVTANSTDAANSSVTLDGVTVHGAERNGFAYIRAGNNVSGNTPMPFVDTIGAIAILNSEFYGNATSNSGGNGRGDILLYGFNGDFTIDGVNIHDPAAGAQKAIQVRGLQDGGDAPGVGPYDAAGTFSFSDLTIGGSYQQELIAFYNIAEFASFVASNVSLDGTAPWGLINFDGVGGTIDLSTGFVTLANGAGVIGVLQGLDTNDELTGTSGADAIIGRGGDDIIDAGGGDDTITWRVGDGADTIDGGGNTATGDTLVVASTAPGQTITLTAPGGGGFTVGDGADTAGVDNVEEVTVDFSAGSGTLHVVGDFDGSGIDINTITVNGGTGNDTVNAELMTGDGPGSPVGIDFSGNGGDDTFISGTGDDYFDGGDGTDRHEFDGNSANYTVVLNTDGSVTITDNVGDDGVDTSSETVEQIVFGDLTLDLTMAVRLFNADDDSLLGTFDNVDDAINAVGGQAATDLRIEVDGSKYSSATESLNIDGSDINGKNLTIVGDGVTIGETTGDAVTLSGDFGGGSLAFENVTIGGGHNGISADSTVSGLTELKLDGVTVSGNANHGLYLLETRDGIAQLTITGGSFAGNGGHDGNTSHIKLFGFSGDAHFTGGLTLDGDGDPAYGIEIVGGTQGGNANPVPANEPAIGDISFDGVVLTGSFAKNAVALYNFLNLNGLEIQDLDLSGATAGWEALFNIDGIAASYDVSGYNIAYPDTGDANFPAGGIVAELQGDKDGQSPVNNTITGGDANERLIGKEGNDTLHGGGGDDELYGHDKPGGAAEGDTGNDTLVGGAGNDRMFGGAGEDTLYGDGDDDTLDGGAGEDTLIGGLGNDTLDGGADDDEYLVTSNIEQYDTYQDSGATTGDTIRATANNALIGLAGDFSQLSSGIDIIDGGVLTNVRIWGDSGNNTLDFSNMVVTNATIDGRGGDDTIIGTDDDDRIIVAAGNDTVDGGEGSDTYIQNTNVEQYDTYQDSGLTGTDTILVTTNNALVGLAGNFSKISSGIEVIDGNGHSNVRIWGDAAGNTLDFSGMTVLDATIYGRGGNDTITGTSGDDNIDGGAGEDTLIGGLGNDTLDGGADDDVYLVTSNIEQYDTYQDSGASFGDTIRATANNALIGLAGNFSQLSSGIDIIDGGVLTNVRIWGDSGNNTLDFSNMVVTNATIDGRGGDDTIIGTDGDDRIIVAAGNDTVDGGEGSDTYIQSTTTEQYDTYQDSGLTGTDTILVTTNNALVGLAGNFSKISSGLEVIDGNGHSNVRIWGDAAGNTLDFSGMTVLDATIYGRGGNDTITGTSGDDNIDGGADNDTVNGGGGDDMLFGGAGDDILVGGGDPDSAADRLTGNAGNDTLYGNETETTEAANKFAQEGEGDIASYAGSASDYDVTWDAGLEAWQVTRTTGGGEGAGSVDTLYGIEGIDFGNNGAVDLDLTMAVQLFDDAGNLLGTFDNLKDAVDFANADTGRTDFNIHLTGDDINVGGSRVVIEKNISITGDGMDQTTLNADFSTTSNHNDDSGALIVVADGFTGNFAGFRIDGDGDLVAMAIRHHGTGTVDGVHFENIIYDNRIGTGISVRGDADVDVINSVFTNIGRIGAHFRDAGVTGLFRGNKYTGKAAGDHLDYAAEAGGGANVQFIDNFVTGNISEVDALDTSAGFLVTTYFGLGTVVTFTGNTVENSYEGVAIGYPGIGPSGVPDESDVTFDLGNIFTGNVGAGVTVVGNAVIDGTELVDGTFDWTGAGGNNEPSGADLNDVLRGGDGNDVITGFGGADDLRGDGGDDILHGDGGNDDLRGGQGNDEIFGGGGNDTIRGGGGGDILRGEDGDDDFIVSGAGEGFDTYFGGGGDDWIYAGSNNTIIGLAGDFGNGNSIRAISNNTYSNVLVWGEDSGNTFNFANTALNNVIFDGRGGDDEIFASNLSVSQLSGGAGDDIMHGSDVTNTYYYIEGTNQGYDTYWGGNATDTISARDVNTIIGLKGNFGAVNDIEEIRAQPAYTNVRVWGENSGNTLDFSQTTLDNVTVDGRGGDDVLIGNNSANTMRGGADNDTITGRGGKDTLYGDAGDDTFIYNVGDGRDRIDGGADEDELIVNGTGADERFNVNLVDIGGTAHVGINITDEADPAAPATSGNYEAATVDVEDITINTGGGTDDVVVTGSLDGAGLAYSTIHVDLGEGDDTLDLSDRESGHRVVVEGGEGSDTVNFGFDFSTLAPGAVQEIDDGVSITYTTADGKSVTDEFYGVDTFRFSDGDRTQDELFNAAPAAQDGSGSGNEDAVTIEVTLNGTDIDGNLDGYVIKSLPDPAQGVLKYSNGDPVGIGHQVSSPVYFAPAADWSGQTTFTYTAIDADGVQSANTATATVTVAPVADAPVLELLGGAAGKLYFSAFDGENGYELWSYDGASEPEMVHNINPGSGPSFAGRLGGLIAFGGKLYFCANDGANGFELWSHDGVNPPEMVHNINPGSAHSEAGRFGGLAEFGGKLYFSATDGEHGYELWSYDGVDQPVMVHNINPGGVGSDAGRFGGLVEFGGKLYFSAYDGANGFELWSYDGVNQPEMVHNINPGSGSSQAGRSGGLIAFGGKLYFTAYDGANGFELWSYDGVDQPVMVHDINPASSHAGRDGGLVEFGGKLYFTATDGVNGYELWSYDGASEPVMVHNINPGSGSSDAGRFGGLIAFGGKLYFSASDGENGFELWSYDGVDQPVMVHNINPGSGSSDAGRFGGLVEFGGKLYFSASDGENGYELWSYDGVSELVMHDILPGGLSSFAGDGARGTSSSTAFAVLEGGAVGDEGTAIEIPVTAALTDLDGSESFVLVLTGFPDGAEFNVDGTLVPAAGDDPARFEIGQSDFDALGGPLTVTPPENYNGAFTLSIEMIVTDTAMIGGAEVSDTTSVTKTIGVTVMPVNDAPEGADKTVVTDEDIPYTFSASDFSFSDAEGGDLYQIRVDSLPAHGVLRFDGGSVPEIIAASELHKLVFATGLDENGDGYASFTFSVGDDQGAFDPTPNTITIDVKPVNDAPMATADAYTTDEDTLLVVDADDGVLHNDNDAENDALTAAIVDDVDHGTLVFSDDGSFTYTPDENFSGADSFTYRANDGTEDGNVATVSITVNPGNEVAGYVSGGEFLVNHIHQNHQYEPVVATLKGGGFAVVWYSNDGLSGDNSGGYTIKARVFDANGNETVPEFRVNTNIEGDQGRTTVEALDNGGFVVAWHSYDAQQPQDQIGTALKARIFNADGEEAVSEFVVNQVDAGSQVDPSISMLKGGGFVVTWRSNDVQGDVHGHSVKGRIFDDNGQAVSDEFLINEFKEGNQAEPSVAALRNGGFVVTWNSEDAQQPQDQDNMAIKARIFDAGGAVTVSEFVVNQLGDDVQTRPVVSALGDGFLVMWQSDDHQQTDTESNAVKARIFDADGNGTSDEFIVNEFTSGNQTIPAVTALDGGGFVAVWQSDDAQQLQDQDGTAIKARIFDGNGNETVSEFVVNEFFQSNQSYPTVAALDDGGFVVTWQSPDGQQGSGFEIKGRIFDALGQESGNSFAGDAQANIIIGLEGNDILIGGLGDDTLTGGDGGDQFRLASNSGTDTINDFVRGTDKIAFLDNNNWLNGSVNFINTVGSSGGTALNASDFVYRQSIALITNDDNKIIRIGNSQSEGGQITGVTSDGPAYNSYIIVFNNTSGRSEVWFDSNWQNTSGRIKIATLDNTSYANHNLITASDIVVYSSAADPIILDLDGNGYAFATTVAFDIDADGAKDQIAWNSSGDGMLAYDLNGNGVIEDGAELFTPWFGGGEFATGGAALASLDENGDGVIDAADAAFANLSIWTDADADGETDAGELTSLAENGIISISAPAAPAGDTIDGQAIVGEGTFERTDGSSGSYVEVALETTFGEGGETFVIDPSALSEVGMVDVIADYSQAQGDVLDLGGLLDAAFGGNPPATEGTVEEAVNLVANGGNTDVVIDTNGAEAGGGVVVAQLVGTHTAINILYDGSGGETEVL